MGNHYKPRLPVCASAKGTLPLELKSFVAHLTIAITDLQTRDPMGGANVIVKKLLDSIANLNYKDITILYDPFARTLTLDQGTLVTYKAFIPPGMADLISTYNRHLQGHVYARNKKRDFQLTFKQVSPAETIKSRTK